MKHFIKKISLMGAGGGKKKKGSSGPPPDPPRLDPPVYGKYKSYPSYSSAEIVDLICDGPIEGLVNEAGAKVTDENILQAIYLDNTPISSINNTGPSNVANNPFSDLDNNSLLLRPLANFCSDINNPIYSSKVQPANAARLWFGPISNLEASKPYMTQTEIIQAAWAAIFDQINKKAKGPIPFTSAKENIGSLITITESYSKLRADGLDEKYKKATKTKNELTNKLNKLDDLEQATKTKYTDKLIEKNSLVYDKGLIEEAINSLQQQLDSTPNNKANKKTRDDLNKQINTQKTNLKNKNSAIAKVDKEIADLDVPGKEAQQSNIIKERDAQQEILNKLNAELAAIPAKQKQNRKNKQKEINAVAKKIKDLNGQIQSLEKQLEKLGNFNQIEKVKQEINQQEEILNGIKFDWRPVDNSQRLDIQYNVLNTLVVQNKLKRNEYVDGGFPSWNYVNDKFQIHFRNETAYGPGESWNLNAWESYLNSLLPTLNTENLEFERDYVYKILAKINKIKSKIIIDGIEKSSNINKTFSDFVKRQNPLLIYSIGVRTDNNNILKSNASNLDKTVNKDDINASFYIDTLQEWEDRTVYTCLIPQTTKLDATNQAFTGNIYGFILISFTEATTVDGVTKWQSNNLSYDKLDTTLNMTNSIGSVGISNTASEIFLQNARKSKYDVEHEIRIFKTRLSQTLTLQLTQPFKLKFSRSFTQSALNKYNFSNILNEFRPGEEFQKPFAYFNNTNIDTEVNYKLTGPFRKTGNVRKFNPNQTKMLEVPPSAHFPGDSANETGGTPNLLLRLNSEGGQDVRSYKKYVGDKLTTIPGVNFHSVLDAYNEDPIPFTHYIENPDVEEIIVTLEIRQLTDVLTTQAILAEESDDKNKDQPGTRIPTLVQIRVDYGYVVNENFTTSEERDYKIVGLIESPVLIDLGNYENKFYEDDGAYKAGNSNFKGPYIGKPDNHNDNNPSKKIKLPTLTNSQRLLGAKRFIKIYKVSTETNSVAIKREVFVNKITEVLPLNFSYPFSAMVASKIDARNFTSIPNRSFDCRLKKVMIPSNYFPLREEFPHRDKRYWSSVSSYDSAAVENKVIYKGDWNGDLKLGWTDNPAWILYDILTNVRYGLGEYLEDSSINIWELYKIGRYCDAVNDDGLFIGVKDLYGGLEPRFSCNIMFNESTKIFDAVNTIINLFRGNLFFSNSELHFSDDRPREPIALFTNSNVADGFFNYTNNKKDESFNVVEVAYVDKLDNFKTKIEVVQDEDDIRYRGYSKTVVNTFGVTSKSMARRIGQHIIWQTTKENQAVEFVTGPEALLCRPGDLIIIEDEMKSRTANYGRILDVDAVNRTLTLDNPVNLQSLENKITIYTPTGYKTAAELERLSDASRQRIDQFKIEKDNALSFTNDKIYQFSYYSTQYLPEDIYKVTGYQHAIYNDSKDRTKCWYYDLAFSGWVFSSNGPFPLETDKKYISEITRDGIQGIEQIYSYLTTAANKRGILLKAPKLIYNEKNWTGALNGSPSVAGIHDDEIRTQNNRQITTYSVSGVSALSSDTEINNGSLVYLNQNNFNLNLLNIVEPGSTYRFQVKNTTDQIYKVISIKENSPNEYVVLGTKYDSGKWETIENDIYIENAQQQYNSNLFQVVNGYSQPENVSIDFSSRNELDFSLMGEWYPPQKENGLTYGVSLENPNIGFFDEKVINTQNQGGGPYRIYYSGLNDQGLWTFKVQVLSKNPLKYNSYFSTAKKFIGYENSNPNDLDSPVIATVKAI